MSHWEFASLRWFKLENPPAITTTNYFTEGEGGRVERGYRELRRISCGIK